MDINTLNSYINDKIEENLNLDYKAADALQRNDKKTNEISKDVSAFANSDGGLIIYGIKEDPDSRHLPHSIDPINRNDISKEWLEQIIQSKIRPRISNVLIHSITVCEESNTVVYVVEVPKSDTAHQANDKRYYKRFNFNSEPMHDYEIRDILNRSKYPVMGLDFKITIRKTAIKNDFGEMFPEMGPDRLNRTFDTSIKYKTDCELTVIAKNEGRVLANYLNAYLNIPLKYLKEPHLYKQEHEMASIFMENTVRDVVDTDFSLGYPKTKYGPSRYDPILPKRYLRLENIKIHEAFINSSEQLTWIVYCDNAEPITGTIKASEILISEL